jgi:hypothetical protein
VHVGEACAAGGHTLPHVMQFAGSLLVSVQPEVHIIDGGAQDATHMCPPMLAAQSGVGVMHRMPQEPHVSDTERLASHPFVSSESQSPKPASQMFTHIPSLQLRVAFVGAAPQALPHVPQLVSVVLRSTSQPFNTIASQSPKGGSQPPTAQAPITQDSIAFGSEQALPQEPQFDTVVSGVSQPVDIMLSQLP